MKCSWYIVRSLGETTDFVTVETEEGDGIYTILNEVYRGIRDNDLEVTMVDGDPDD